jgi:hypothetical protein
MCWSKETMGHVEALDPEAGYWARRFAQLVNWRARGEKA